MQKVLDVLQMMQQIKLSLVVFHPTRRMTSEPLPLPLASLIKVVKKTSPHGLKRNLLVNQISRRTCDFGVYLKSLTPAVVMVKLLLPMSSQTWSLKVQRVTVMPKS
jgi:hypothetical protein